MEGEWWTLPTSRDWLSSSFAVEALRSGKSQEQIVAFVSGDFNVVHPGHLRLLKFASENSDILVVGINPNESNNVTVPASLRIEALDAITIVDHTVILDQPLQEFLLELRPDIVVKGDEHRHRTNIEEETVKTYGGRLVFASGDITYSSLAFLSNEETELPPLSITQSRDYMARHEFSISDLRSTIAKFSGLRVAVVGDLILDSYISCDPIGMSQEDPTIVVTPIDEELFLGGAGIVAVHARSLGAEVSFLSVTGNDEHAKIGIDRIDEAGVQPFILTDTTRPTVHKKRYRAHGKTLLRVNSFRQHPISDDLINQTVRRFKDIMGNVDLLLFSDFNYGCLPQALVDALVECCRSENIMMTADSQASSQYGDISRFRNMTMITPTEREARLAVRDFASGLVTTAEKLHNASKSDHVVLTLADDGLLIRTWQEKGMHTDRLPAFNKSPQDVAGAGDSLFTSSSMALCVGADIWQSMYLGSVAASLQVNQVGNKPLQIRDIAAQLIDLSD